MFDDNSVHYSARPRSRKLAKNKKSHVYRNECGCPFSYYGQNKYNTVIKGFKQPHLMFN